MVVTAAGRIPPSQMPAGICAETMSRSMPSIHPKEKASYSISRNCGRYRTILRGWSPLPEMGLRVGLRIAVHPNKNTPDKSKLGDLLQNN